VDKAVYPPISDVSGGGGGRGRRGRGRRGRGRRGRGRRRRNKYTKQPHKPQIHQHTPPPHPITRNHQASAHRHGDGKIRLKLPARNEAPELVGPQLGIVVVAGGQHDGDGASDGAEDAEGVAGAKRLLEQKGRDEAVGDEGDDAERRHNGRGGEAVGEKVAGFARGHEHDADPPVGAPQVGWVWVCAVAFRGGGGGGAAAGSGRGTAVNRRSCEQRIGFGRMLRLRWLAVSCTITTTTAAAAAAATTMITTILSLAVGCVPVALETDMRIALHVQRKGYEDIAYNGGDDANQTAPILRVSAPAMVVPALTADRVRNRAGRC